jgi:hypothetical protein
MCSFHVTSGCFHGKACDFAHDVEELLPQPDLRKSTLCINYSQGYEIEISPAAFYDSRCAISDCRFAHGLDELRRVSVAQGRVGAVERGNESSIQKSPFDENARPRLNLNDALSSTSIPENNLGDTTKRRLDLFPCLDFSDEISYDNEDDDSLLSCISREVLHLKLADECSPVGGVHFNVEGDHSPWNVPG